MTLSKNVSFAIAAGIVVLGLVAYFMWMKPAANEEVLISEGPAGEAQAAFMTLAAQLGPISFDTSILSDPRFLALIDIKTAILPEAIGKKDPFAPLSGVRTR